jgi:hypothetical protein
LVTDFRGEATTEARTKKRSDNMLTSQHCRAFVVVLFQSDVLVSDVHCTITVITCSGVPQKAQRKTNALR